jgi:hypothetical protein
MMMTGAWTLLTAAALIATMVLSTGLFGTRLRHIPVRPKNARGGVARAVEGLVLVSVLFMLLTIGSAHDDYRRIGPGLILGMVAFSVAAIGIPVAMVESGL